MHLIVSGLGSYGDVLPMVGLGAAMHARGHRVQVIANPYFRPVVEYAGLELLPLGSAEEYLKLTEHPDLWHPRRGLKLVLTRGAMAYLRATYALYEQRHRPGETVLAAHGLDLAARLFHEKHGTPMATVHFAPFALVSLHSTPRYIGAPSMAGWPRWLKAAQFWAVDRWLVDPLVGPPLNQFRAELGLPPVARVFSRWNHSPRLVLGMFPEWFGPPQPDWPPQTVLVGFPLSDAQPRGELPAECEAFLRAGDPPIVFAPGSANVQAEDFFRTAVAACERLRRRALLATKYAEQLPKPLPASVQQVGFVPFSRLLPRAAALVHHGGIGTCAQGLACGLPQLVMPMAYDQLDNGLRLQRLGVGAVVRQHRFTPPRVAAALAGLLEDSAVRERAGHWASRCNGAAALGRASELLEQMARESHSRGARLRSD